MKTISSLILTFLPTQELKHLGNAENNLNMLFELVKKGRTNSQPVFFILEEFHLFADHPRQSLLYNLLDMTQTASMQVSFAFKRQLRC
jgi:Cdc6-like AAA superfamily ATPase